MILCKTPFTNYNLNTNNYENTYKTKILQILSILFLAIAGATLQSCSTDCEDNCDNGYCSDGTCECFNGWTGEYCDKEIGGNNSNCNSTPYYGPQNCSSSGYVTVSATTCCSSSYPYHNSATSSCYQTCEDAYSADNSGYISYGTGQTGSSGNNSGYICSGSSCNYVTSGADYSSQSACENACGGGSSGCDWSNALSGLSVVIETGSICGNPNDKRFRITNNWNQKVKIFICTQRSDGTYGAWGDSVGTEAGDTWSGGYACPGTGNYIIYAEFYDIYWANGSCSYPGCD